MSDTLPIHEDDATLDSGQWNRLAGWLREHGEGMEFTKAWRQCQTLTRLGHLHQSSFRVALVHAGLVERQGKLVRIAP